MNVYSKDATDLVTYISFIEHADGGMLKLSALARNLVTLQFNIKNLVLFVAVSIEYSSRSPSLGERQLASNTADLQLYFCSKLYNHEKIFTSSSVPALPILGKNSSNQRGRHLS